MKKNKYIWIGAGLALLLAVFLLWGRDIAGANADMAVPVKKGRMDITIITTGELQALNSEDIKGPGSLTMAGIYQVKIADLVPEGSIVKEGDIVAELDRTDINSKIRDLRAELEKITAQYQQTQLDTQLEMRGLRDDLINQKYGLEEKQLTVDQSKFEPPAVMRQAEIDLEKAKRTYEQTQKNYQLKLRQNVAKMRGVASTMQNQQAKLEQMTELMKEFDIKAPKGGMLIYYQNWSGRKFQIGSTVSSFNPIVATLPDLSVMISRTYVNEIDISKVKTGQAVEVSIDAFPDRKYSGTVTKVANIGEQLPNTQTKVFEVSILMGTTDTLLRPAMTTSNNILTASLPDSTLYIPIEALHDNDSISYVYKAQGSKKVRQQVKAGAMNATMAQITAGLKEAEEVYLNVPTDTAGMPWQRLPANGKNAPPAQPAPVQHIPPDSSAIIPHPSRSAVRR